MQWCSANALDRIFEMWVRDTLTDLVDAILLFLDHDAVLVDDQVGSLLDGFPHDTVDLIIFEGVVSQLLPVVVAIVDGCRVARVDGEEFVLYVGSKIFDPLDALDLRVLLVGASTVSYQRPTRRNSRF